MTAFVDKTVAFHSNPLIICFLRGGGRNDIAVITGRSFF